MEHFLSRALVDSLFAKMNLVKDIMRINSVKLF